MEQNKKYRNWCWTDFELDEDFYDTLRSPKWRYLLRGNEVCKTTGKKHWQCYGISSSPRTERSLRKEMKPRHIEFCKGTEHQNEVYCSKEGDVIEWGDKPKGAGKRTDLDVVRDKVATGGTMREVITTATSFQQIRVAEKCLEYMETKRTWKPKVYWYYGATGTGKTKLAFEQAGDDCWVSGVDGKWFQGYDAHENVIFDDFRGDFCKFHILLRLLDRYAFRIEYKGGARQFLAKNIWITCPVHPADVYGSREDVNQLLRRIDVIKCFNLEQRLNGTEVGGNTIAKAIGTPTTDDFAAEFERLIST